MPFILHCTSKKSKVSVSVDGRPLKGNNIGDGEYVFEQELDAGEHEITVAEDHALYHNSCYIQLINPIHLVRKSFFLKNFMYSDTYNSEADVLSVRFRSKSEKQKMKIELIPKRENNNYTQYYDSLEITDCGGLTIIEKRHTAPNRRYLLNYCMLNFIPPVLSMLAVWVSMLFAYNSGLLLTAALYSIYVMISILAEVRKIEKASDRA